MSRIVAWLTERSYQRAAYVVAAVVVLLGVGAVSAVRINQELLPDIQFPLVVVVAEAPGMEPGEVARTTIAPIEASTANLAGLRSSQSTSTRDLGVLILLFDFGVDIDETNGLVKEALDDIQFPSGVKTSMLLLDPSSLPVIMATLEGDVSDQELLGLAHGVVAPRLGEIDGVGDVEIVGGALEQISVAVDRDALFQHGVTYEELAGILKSNNVILPAGFVFDSASGGVVPVEAVLAFSSVEDLSNTAVPTDDGDTVFLNDIAQINSIEVMTTGINRSNGTPAVGLQIAKTKAGNTVAVAHGVLSAFDELEEVLPDGVSITVIQDQADFIEESVFDMVFKGVIGGILAVLIVLAFLRNTRSTLVTAISIPFSILAAIIALWSTGNTLNLMTLGGLTIAIGRVIDDSIVVLESIFRHLAAGEETHTAVSRGAREVTLAIVGATATTAAVFLPLGLVGGLIGELFLPFALAVVFALAASLIAAVTVVPALVRLLMNKGVKLNTAETEHGRLSHAYRPVLEWALDHRFAMLGISTVLFVGSMALVPTLPLVFLPDSGENTVTITVPAQPGEAPETVLQRAIAVEGLISEYDVENYQTVITGASGGLGALGAVITGQDPNSASITVKLASNESKSRVANQLRERFPEEIENGEGITVSSEDAGFSTSSVNITVAATSPAGAAQLGTVAAEVEAVVAGFDEIVNAHSDVSSVVPAIELQIDQQATAKAGFSPEEIASAVAQLSRGEQVTMLQTQSGMVPVQLSLRTEGPLTTADLARLPLGRGVVLGDLATPVEVTRQTMLTRVDGREAATVGGEIVADDIAAVSLKVQEAVDAVEIPAGIEVQHGGVGSDIDEGFTNMIIAIAISILLVYLIMAGLFRSWADPFVILFTLPLAAIGAIGALWVTGSALSINAMLGLLMLVGIVVTNAIVMLEYVIMLRRERGFDLRHALVEGAMTRLRPVLMTALATMLALIPLALGFGGSGLISEELGRVVIGGLFTSTFLTLLVVPVVYSLMDGVKRRIGRTV